MLILAKILGTSFTELIEEIKSKKVNFRDGSAELLRAEDLMDSAHTFVVNVEEEKLNPLEAHRKETKPQKYSPFQELFQRFSTMKFNFHYQCRARTQTLKESSIESLAAKLFFEKNSNIINWSDKMHEKINFILGIQLDLLGMVTKALMDLLPTKFEIVQEKLLNLLPTQLREFHAEELQAYLVQQKAAYTSLRFSLMQMYDTISESMKSLKAFLENEITIWRDNKAIKDLFSIAKRKLRNVLREKFDEDLFQEIQTKYIDLTIKNMEKKISTIQQKIQILSSYRGSFIG